jgi:hypothetical protein
MTTRSGDVAPTNRVVYCSHCGNTVPIMTEELVPSTGGVVVTSTGGVVVRRKLLCGRCGAFVYSDDAVIQGSTVVKLVESDDVRLHRAKKL